jgi:hypothetical protein
LVDGQPVRAHIQAAIDAGRKSMQSELDNPAEMPPGLDRLWLTFLELSATERTYAEGGFPLPLSSQAILAWCVLFGTPMEPWEVRTIRRLDQEWLKARNSKREGV